MNILLPIAIAVPIVGALLLLFVPKRFYHLQASIVILSTIALLGLAIQLFGLHNLAMSAPLGYGINFALRLDHFSAFILLAIAGFGLLIAIYCVSFLRDKSYAKLFYVLYLISLGFSAGAALSNNLVFLLFFWEGLLGTLFGMICIGGKTSYHTAVKSLVLVGISDFIMMFGIGLTGYLAKTFTMSEIAGLPLDALGGIAFICLMIGAMGKAGAMPFHSWIPDAAIDAPLPLLAFLPASLDKLLGIYFLGRISLQMFHLTPFSWVSTLLMVLGGITILLAVAMALIQKNYKRLLSYHAISQVGYMILGIGTALPLGIIGGLFHMINHAMYKSCLFLTGGAVEQQTGTTELNKLGGLAGKMPITFICFLIAAASISGVPPFNGFFSKELIYDGALARGWIFYAMAVAGSVLTAASFLKLGHAAYIDNARSNWTQKKITEAPIAMLIPMIALAALCVLFGVWNILPIRSLIMPILSHTQLAGLEHSPWGWPANWKLVLGTGIALGLAYLNHYLGVRRTGSGLKAVDHIHYLPVLSTIYRMAERRWFDPYEIVRTLIVVFAEILWCLDRVIDWLYDGFTVKVVEYTGWIVKLFHTGDYALYLASSFCCSILLLVYLLR